MEKDIDADIKKAEYLSKNFVKVRKVHLSMKLFDLFVKFAIAFVLFAATKNVAFLGTLVWFCFGYQTATVAIELHGWIRERRMTKKLIEDTDLLLAMIKHERKHEQE